MIFFNCDYNEGAHENIIKRLAETNREQTVGYGEDDYCRQAAEMVLEKCEMPEAQVHFLVGGTQTNLTVIAAGLKPWQGVISADTGHINCHETGVLGILSAEDHEKVRSAMELVHAWDLKDRDFSAVSDGQRQRILLARAICQEPEVIVLDEPTSFLDIRHKLELLSILKEMVRKQHVAVLMSLHELDLAQKVSDLVICVHGDRIERCGVPEEIFTDEYIRQLYGVTAGSYNASFGCLEMEPARGKPEVFVIAGGGSGIPVFRQLQRQGIPFATGVLQENDVDYQVAKALAAKVVTERPFEEISEEHYQEAVELMRSCKKVILAVSGFGSMNRRNEELKKEAEKLGILEK